MYELAEGFKHMGETIDVIDEETIAGISGWNPEMKRALHGSGIIDLSLFWQRALRYACETGGFDVLWLHQPCALPWTTRKYLLKIGRKVVVTWHSTYLGWKKAILEAGISSRLAGYYIVCSRLESACAKSLKDVPDIVHTVVSPHIREELRDQGAEGTKILFVPNGIPNLEGNVPLESKLARISYGLPVDAKILVYVGSLTMIKQPAKLLEAYDAIRNQYPETVLLIIGTGPLFTYVKHLAKCREGIYLTGQLGLKSVLTLLRISDVFMSFSLYEGMSNSELEAASCGLPLLVSDIPAHRDIKNLGLASVGLVKSARRMDFKDLLSKYGSVKDKKAPEYCRKAGPSARFMYDWNKVCHRYLQVFRSYKDGQTGD